MDSAEVLSIGETMLLVTTIDSLPLAADRAVALRTAGAESNVVMNLAALGHSTAWASHLGADPLGRIVLDSMVRAGVDVVAVDVVDGAPTGVMFKNPSSDGTTVHYYRSGSAASTMDADFVDALVQSRPIVVHTSGVTLALSVPARAAMEHVLLHRAFRDSVTSFDVNYRASLWHEDAAETLLRFAQSADVVFVGLDEAEVLWGTRTAEEVRSLIHSPSWLVVKDAEAEAVSFSLLGMVRVPAIPVEVVEPVGAGDAFAAGWLSGLLRGLSPATRLQLGHIVAGTALRSTSDQGELPVEADLITSLGLDRGQWAGRVDPRRTEEWQRTRMGEV